MIFSTITVIVTSVFFSCLLGAVPDMTVVKHVCTQRHYQDPVGGYGICLYYAVHEVTAMAAKRGYGYFVDGRTHGELTGKCYGHAAYDGKLAPGDCTSCLDTALNDMADYCTTSIGARTKLKDCRIRYEDYPFDPNY